MTMRRIGVTVTFLVAALAVVLPRLRHDRAAAAPRGPVHFQSFSNGTGERYVAGPFAAGTQLAITSLTVAAPLESTPVVVGFRIAHGAGSSCVGSAIGAETIFAQAPAGDTLHLNFPEPLLATHATESWCLFFESDVFTDVTIVGVTN
jgi:hypothetical protein